MNGIPHPELEELRQEFPILAQRTYLNSCSLGALSRRSMGYLGEFQALWNGMGASAWYELWLGRLDDLRGSVRRLWSAGKGEVALVPSVSAGLSSIASAVDYSKRNRVVIAEPDFPTLGYQWMARPDVEVVRVPSDDGVGVSPDRWAEYVDERTAIVATSHVFYGTGYIQDLVPIREAAHTAGALCVIDGYQAVGQIPVDPESAGIDVYLGGPLKWLLGGPGMAFLWVSAERVRELTPTMASWFGAKDQFDFHHDRFEFRDDARRFELGTHALPTMYTALGGLEIIHEVGMERIRGRIAALTEHLVDGLEAQGRTLVCAADRERRSGIVMVRSERAGEVVDALADRRIIVDRRGDLVRISPHFYNTVEENQAVLEALQEVDPVARR